MKKKKMNTTLAYFLMIFMLIIFVAINIGALFLCRDMMIFLVSYGTFFAPVFITVILVLIDRLEYRSSANGMPSMVLVFVIHALSIVVASPVLAHTLGWKIMGTDLSLLQSIIVSLICGAIVIAIQIAIINYLCDNYFFTYEPVKISYTPSSYSSSSSSGYSPSPSPSLSSDDDTPRYYGVSNSDGDDLGFIPKNTHEELDDLSGSFTGTST